MILSVTRARRCLGRLILGKDEFFNSDASREIDRLTALLAERDSKILELTAVEPTRKQLIIALGKYAAGYRPGQEGWSPQDQVALQTACGIPTEDERQAA